MFAPLTLLVLAAQGPVAATPPVVATRDPVAIEVPAPAPASAPAPSRDEARLARADSLAFAGDMSAAERVYRALIDDQTDAGQYAKDALWHLAMAYYLADDPLKTVRALDQLAAAADRFGDPETELVASYESARFYSALRNDVVARDRVDRVRSLLQSPVIPASVKADYEQRMKTQS
jgi:hypothetical protein